MFMRRRIAGSPSAVDEVAVAIIELDGNADHAGTHVLDAHELARQGTLAPFDFDLHRNRPFGDEEDALLGDVLARTNDRAANHPNRHSAFKVDTLEAAVR